MESYNGVYVQLDLNNYSKISEKLGWTELQKNENMTDLTKWLEGSRLWKLIYGDSCHGWFKSSEDWNEAIKVNRV